MAKAIEKLKNLPDKPGVYLMKDGRGKIIYVGKAISLKKRVRSYFQSSGDKPARRIRPGGAGRMGTLRSNIADLEYIITDSETEALVLECNLIKAERPRYNVRLRDDKKYPFVKLTNEDYPCLFITRNLKADGSKYYGPYTNVKLLRKTLKSMRELFPLRSCRRKIGPLAKRPCLNYDLKQCVAPCSGRVGKEEYQNLVKGACLFLEGRRKELVKELKKRMETASRHLRFEEASRWRDKITAIEKVTEGGGKRQLKECSPFQRRVWEVVKTIPHGQTRSYKWVAERLGNPKAARAVGQALKKNPLPGIIPCHRVIRSNGRLGGFSQGKRRKRSLLLSEGVR